MGSKAHSPCAVLSGVLQLFLEDAFNASSVVQRFSVGSEGLLLDEEDKDISFCGESNTIANGHEKDTL